MRNNIFVLLMVLVLTGCFTAEPEPKPKPKPEPINYDAEFWGEWIRLNSSSEWYITNDGITKDGIVQTGLTLERESPHVIKVTAGEEVFYLYEERTANATITGKVAEFFGGTTATGSPGRSVHFVNTRNASNTGTVTTVADGSFTIGSDPNKPAERIIPGDTYILTTTNGIDSQENSVSPAVDGEDIGVITLTAKQHNPDDTVTEKEPNFRVTLIQNDTYAFADANLKFNLKITNTGTSCTDPQYSLEFENGLQPITGQANVYKSFQLSSSGFTSESITVRCQPLSDETEFVFKKITVKLRYTSDGRELETEDSVSIKFYQKPVIFSIASEAAMGGLFIGANTSTFRTEGYKRMVLVTLPWSKNPYLAVFFAINEPSPYSIGVGIEPDTIFISNPEDHEPNDSETDAVKLNILNGQLHSYLTAGDVDFFELNLTHSAPVLEISEGAAGELVLQWADIQGANGYEVYYSPESKIANAISVPVITSNTYTITGLEEGTTYFVWVKVLFAEGDPVLSAATECMTKPAVPEISEVVINTKNGVQQRKELLVSWNAVKGTSGYDLYYSTEEDPENATKHADVGLANGTKAPTYFTYTLTGLADITEYYIWLKSKNVGGSSAFSEAVSARTLLPPPVLDPIRTGVQGELLVSWGEALGATSYELYYNYENKAETATQVADELANNTYSLRDLGDNVLRYFWLRSKNEDGTSGFSSVKTGMTKTPVPKLSSVEVPNSENNSGQLLVTWEKVTGATSYNLYYSDEDIPATAVMLDKINNESITGTSAGLRDLEDATTYNVWISAFNQGGESTLSEPLSGTTKPADPLTPVVTVIRDDEGVQERGKLRVTWDAVTTGATSYDLYYDTKNNAESEIQAKATKIASVTSPYDLTELSDGTEYFVWIYSKNSSGGGYSPVAHCYTMLPAPEAPEVTTPNVERTLTVNWQARTDVPGIVYDLFFNTEENIPTDYKLRKTDVKAPYALNELRDGTYYYIWLRARTPHVQSLYSSPYATGATKLPDFEVIEPVATTEPGTLMVKWSAISGATSYDLYYLPAPDGAVADDTKPSEDAEPYQANMNITSPHTITGLENDANYYVWLRARDGRGTPSGWSPNNVGITILPAPDQPTIAEPTDFGNLDISWKAVDKAVGYYLYYGTTSGVTDQDAPTMPIPVNGLSYSLDKLHYGTRYYVWVSAESAHKGGKSRDSAGSAIASAVTKIPAPTGLYAKPVSATGILSVTWDPVKDKSGVKDKEYVTGYDLYYSTADNFASATKLNETEKITGNSGSYEKYRFPLTGNFYIWIVAKGPSISSDPSMFYVSGN